jgi:hypothetical protein
VHDQRAVTRTKVGGSSRERETVSTVPDAPPGLAVATSIVPGSSAETSTPHDPPPGSLADQPGRRAATSQGIALSAHLTQQRPLRVTRTRASNREPPFPAVSAPVAPLYAAAPSGKPRRQSGVSSRRIALTTGAALVARAVARESSAARRSGAGRADH